MKLDGPGPTVTVRSVLVKAIPTPENGVGVEVPSLYDAITEAVVTHVDGVIVNRVGL